jgi:hypothetical protein
MQHAAWAMHSEGMTTKYNMVAVSWDLPHILPLNNALLDTKYTFSMKHSNSNFKNE